MKFLHGKPVIRCSSLDQLLSCHASRTVNARLGEVRDDESDSWEGQWCHFQSARIFVDKFGAMAPEGGLVGPKLPPSWQPESISNWVVDFFVHAVMEDIPGDWAMEVEAEMLLEFPTFWLSGHVDVSGIAPDASAVKFRDLKRGKNVVDAAECNWQMLGYAALYKGAYGDVLKSVEPGIVQPLLSEDEGQRVSRVLINEQGTFDDAGRQIGAATINDVIPFLNAQITAALADPRTLNSGLKQCRWCPAALALACPALEKDPELMKLELTDEALAAITATPDLETLTRWSVMRKHLEPKFKKAGELLKARLDAGVGEFVSKDGAKVFLKPTLGPREFVDDNAKEQAWEEVAGTLEPARAYACMDLSFTELEKQYAAQLKLPLDSKGKDSGKRQVEQRFSRWITRKPAKQLTIVV